MAQERGQDQDAAQDVLHSSSRHTTSTPSSASSSKNLNAQLSEGHVFIITRHRRQLHGQHGRDCRGGRGARHPTKKSKGYALQWMFDRLFKMDKQYDAVCVFDADNLVHPQFLMEMNSRLCKGDKVIQGYMDAGVRMRHIGSLRHVCHRVLGHLLHLAPREVEHRPLGLPRRHGHAFASGDPQSAAWPRTRQRTWSSR